MSRYISSCQPAADRTERDAHAGDPDAIIRQAARELEALERALREYGREVSATESDAALALRSIVWSRIGSLSYWLTEAPKHGK